jgi:hypothetical protein
MSLRNSDWGPLGRNNKDKMRLGARPYKCYTALLTQTTTDAPVATVLENTLGDEVVWTRASTGAYEGTITGRLIEGKTIAVILNSTMTTDSDADKMLFYRASVDAVGLITYSDSFSTPADAVLSDTPIEIRVYS